MPPARATSWGPRADVGVAAVDKRTGKVLWEAWRAEEVPPNASKEMKAAAEYLLHAREHTPKLPGVTPLVDIPIKELAIKDPWPPGLDVPGPYVSQSPSLTYYRHACGVVALDRKTKKEVWRLKTTRYPYPSVVLEVGENESLIQIGSDMPATLRTALVGDANLPMRGLEPHTLKQRAAAATILHHYGDGYLRPDVRKLAEQLRKEKDDRCVEAANALEKRLSNWPKMRESSRLLAGCVAALLEAREGNPLADFPWPDAHRVLAWGLLQELIYGRSIDGYSRQGNNYAYHHGWNEEPVLLPEATKAKLADHCRKAVAEWPDAEKPFAASVLVSTAIGWARLTDAERQKLFLSDHPSVWRWAALALAKNGRRKELMEWVGKRPAEDELDVVWVLKHDLPKEWPDAELKFWLALARRKPGGVAYALGLLDRSIPTDFREPILAYLKGEIDKPTVNNTGAQPYYDLQATLRVLDDWKNAGDTPLLLEYLKHPAHHAVTRINGNQKTEIRVYDLRDRMRYMLEARGVKVPPDVVYEEVIGPAKE